MEAIALGLLATYYAGYFVALLVMPWRVGVSWNAWFVAFMHPQSRRNGIPWAFIAFGKAVLWPVVLAVWLLNEGPPSRVLYGPEAAERLYGDPDRALPGLMTKWKAP